MKRSYLILLALMFSLSVSHADLSIQMEETTVTLDLLPVEIDWDANHGVDWVVPDDTHWLSQTGEPRIPWQMVSVLLPPEANLATVEASLTDVVYAEQGGGFYVQPMPPLITYDEGQSIQVWPADRTLVHGEDVAIYEVEGYWPGEETLKQLTGRVRHWQVLDVAVPLAGYEPVSGSLRLLQAGTLQVDFSHTDAERGTDLTGAERIRQRVVNYDSMVVRYQENRTRGLSRVSPLRRGSDDEDEVEIDPNAEGYCIVTSNTVVAGSETLDDFVTFKRELGFNVWVVTEDDYGTATGQTRADNIRAWLQENYLDYGLTYVLLIGNPTPKLGDVPMKTCFSDSPTDYYYGELTGDWDSNGNGVYGEDGDNPEKYFEVYVGRIPCYGDVSDVDAILAKTMAYQSSHDTPWRRHVYLPLEPLDESTPCYQMGEQIKEAILAPARIKSVRHYRDDYDLDPAPDYLLGQNYPATVWSDQDFGAVVWMCHGSPTLAQEIIATADVPGLDDEHPAAVWQGACLNGFPEYPANLAFSLLKHGAITTCAGTRDTFYSPGMTDYSNGNTNGPMGYHYLRHLVNRESCGEAYARLREELWFYRDNYYRFNLLGDPSVVVFPATPALTLSPTDVFYASMKADRLGTASRDYTLYNNSDNELTWECNEVPGWVTLSMTEGTIAAGDSMDVTVTLDVKTLAGCGLHEASLLFEVVGQDLVETRDIKVMINPTRLSGHWRLDETEGQIAIDDSGADLHGVLLNFSFDTNLVEGIWNTGLYFDGSDDYIQLPNLDFSTADGMSVSLWLNPATEGGAWDRFMDLCNRNGLDNILLSVRGSTTEVAVEVWEGTEVGDSVSVSGAVDLNTWQFLTVTIAADGSVCLYRDGEYLGTGLSGQPGSERRICNFIGKSSWSSTRLYSGLMDDIWLQDRVLTGSEIQDLMAGGPADCPSPKDGSSNFATDSLSTWKGSPAAEAYEVYFGEDANSLEYQGRLSDAVFVPILEKGRGYAWRVDTVTSDRIITGDLWTFNTLDALVWWTFADATDTIHPADEIALSSTMTLGADCSGEILASNGDGACLVLGENGSAQIDSIHADLLAAMGDSLTIFARVCLPDFSAVDDVWRIGLSSKQKGTIGLAGQDTLALELNEGCPRLVVSEAPQSRRSAQETLLALPFCLEAHQWVDLTGVFVADSNTDNDLAEGRLTLYVYDPVTGEALSEPVSLAVECSGLEADWGGDAMNIMFLSDPGNKNDTPAGTRLDLAALWDRALDANEVAALSMTP